MMNNEEKRKFREETHGNLIKFLKDMFRENSYEIVGDENKWRIIVHIAGDDKSGDKNRKEILKIIHEALKTQIKNNNSRNMISSSSSSAGKLKNITCLFDASDGKVSVYHESIPVTTLAKYKIDIIVRGESDELKTDEQECLNALFSTYRVQNGSIHIRNNAEYKKFLNKLLEYHRTYPTWFAGITKDKIISFMQEVEPYKDEVEFIARHEWFKSFVLTAEAISKIMGSTSSDMVFVHVNKNNEITKKIEQVYKKCNDHCKHVFDNINKWCPADIYGVNIRKYKDVMKQLEKLDPKTPSSLNALNLILLRAINKKILIPVSLKKVADRTTCLKSMPNISKVNFNGKFDYQIKFNGLARNTKNSFENASGSAVNLSFSQIYKNSLVKHTTLSFFVKNNTTLTTEIQGDYARHGSTSVGQIEKIAKDYTKKEFKDNDYKLDTGGKFNIKTFKNPQFGTLISGEFKPPQSSNSTNSTFNPEATPVKNTLESYNQFYDNYKCLSSNQVELAAGVKDKKTLYKDIVPASNKHGKNTQDDLTFTTKYFYPKYRAAAAVAHILENTVGGKLPKDAPMSSPLIENNIHFNASVNDAFGQLYLYAASMSPHSAPHYKIY